MLRVCAVMIAATISSISHGETTKELLFITQGVIKTQYLGEKGQPPLRKCHLL